ncbi:hypothetical protein [Isoalcanivorax beigongshangi]|uniref:DUF4304 domain-containing protein n=1 Tax=Isoalcanivorax beigongshangi TaxID=3238810 RepID=A0ABV4AJI5_9GAMM
MAPDHGLHLNREQQAARRVYHRELVKALRRVAKGSEWRVVQDSLFKEQDGWLVCCRPEVGIVEAVTRLVVTLKPMALDPLFWDVMGLADNHQQPLSFRVTGAWVCPALEQSSPVLPELADPQQMAAACLQQAQQCGAAIVSGANLEDFAAGCLQQSADQSGLIASAVMALVLLDQRDAALAVCREAAERFESGGFVLQQRPFVDVAGEWLAAGRTQA